MATVPCIIGILFIKINTQKYRYFTLFITHTMDFKTKLAELKLTEDMTKALETKLIDKFKCSEEYLIPVLVVGTWLEFEAIGNDLGFAAQRGLIIHTDSNLYKSLVRDFGRPRARVMLKPFTAHNDKMGYDWSVANKTYVPDVKDD